ncbi:K(+)/H(+) antiporter [Thoreauomyces humboldtii]|nr:K(+)/H(+) antiporter [Thoreauomyces humboldtii]
MDTVVLAARTTFLDGSNPLTDPISLFLLQAVLIIGLSRLLAIPLAWIRQPRVIAEVIGGILLGPSVLSRSASFKNAVFPASSLPSLSLVANVGKWSDAASDVHLARGHMRFMRVLTRRIVFPLALVFFLFIVGLELDPQTVLRRFRQSAAISISGIVVPFAVGVGVSKLLYDNLSEKTVPFHSFFVFCGVAMSITAFPVLARVLTELKLLASPVGQITLASAAVDDGTAWCLLILVVALINNPSSSIMALYVFLAVIAWALFLYFAVRPVMVKLINRHGDEEGISSTSVFVMFMVILISSWFTEAVGVQAIFGGFLAGLTCPHDRGFAIKLTEKIEDFVTILLLPLFFAYSGLNTNIGLLNDGEAWGYVILVITVAAGGKVIGCSIAARATGFSWRESMTVGWLMSCKGLVELIVLNLGLQAGVINQKIFTIFVVMALVTTLMTVPAVSFLYPPSMYVKSHREHGVMSMSGTGDLEQGEDKMTPGHRGGVNMLICLPNMQTVPSMMSITQLFQSTPNQLSITALRLIKLSQRTSTYLMAANEGETMRADPVINVFRTFGQLNRVTVSTVVTVCPSEDFPESIRDTSNDTSTHFVIIPWQQSLMQSKASCLDDHFIKGSIDVAPCSVAIFVDRGFGVSTENGPHAAIPGQNQSIFVPFFGKADDCEAVRFVANLAGHAGLTVTILDMRPSVAAQTAASTTLAIDTSVDASTAGQANTLLASLTATHKNIKVETASDVSKGAIIPTRAAAFGRKDLLVLSHAAYTSDEALSTWCDQECETSFVIVKKHLRVSLSDEEGPTSGRIMSVPMSESRATLPVVDESVAA